MTSHVLAIKQLELEQEIVGWKKQETGLAFKLKRVKSIISAKKKELTAQKTEVRDAKRQEKKAAKKK